MAVDDEVTIRSLLVLADSSLDERRFFKGRKAEANIFAHVFQSLWIDDPFSICRIELRSSCVVSDLEAAAIAAWNAVIEVIAVIAPDGHLRVVKAHIPCGSTKEEDLLLGGKDEIAYRLREQFANPRAAG